MSDVKYEMARHAVCCLLMNEKGDILAISRGADTGSWGMPGGKVENNESLDVAVVRETYEETGLVIAAPQSVYTAFVPGETNFVCTTFIAQVAAKAPDAPRSVPFEGVVKWVDPNLLAAGPFAQYNQALFDHLNIEWRPAAYPLGGPSST
jgi:8-oxo-dGTP pyrophosphatase MutT (NUDIX family)